MEVRRDQTDSKKFRYADGNTVSTLCSYWQSELWRAFPCSSGCPGLSPDSGKAAAWTPSLWPKKGYRAGTPKDHHRHLTKITQEEAGPSGQQQN